jgi:hypothetical protein
MTVPTGAQILSGLMTILGLTENEMRVLLTDGHLEKDGACFGAEFSPAESAWLLSHFGAAEPVRATLEAGAARREVCDGR